MKYFFLLRFSIPRYAVVLKTSSYCLVLNPCGYIQWAKYIHSLQIRVKVKKLTHRYDIWLTSSFVRALETTCCNCFSVAKLCPALCDPINSSPPGSSVHGTSQARILDGLPFPPAGDLPDPGTEPKSPAWQADSLPVSHLGSPPDMTHKPLKHLEKESKDSATGHLFLS